MRKNVPNSKISFCFGKIFPSTVFLVMWQWLPSPKLCPGEASPSSTSYPEPQRPMTEKDMRRPGALCLLLCPLLSSLPGSGRALLLAQAEGNHHLERPLDTPEPDLVRLSCRQDMAVSPLIQSLTVPPSWSHSSGKVICPQEFYKKSSMLFHCSNTSSVAMRTEGRASFLAEAGTGEEEPLILIPPSFAY